MQIVSISDVVLLNVVELENVYANVFILNIEQKLLEKTDN